MRFGSRRAFCAKGNISEPRGKGLAWLELGLGLGRGKGKGGGRVSLNPNRAQWQGARRLAVLAHAAQHVHDSWRGLGPRFVLGFGFGFGLGSGLGLGLGLGLRLGSGFGFGLGFGLGLTATARHAETRARHHPLDLVPLPADNVVGGGCLDDLD